MFHCMPQEGKEEEKNEGGDKEEEPLEDVAKL